MKLEYDTSRLVSLSEEELEALHEELAQVERDAKTAARLAWEELTRRRSARIPEQTKEKRKRVRQRAKIRGLEDELKKASPNMRP